MLKPLISVVMPVYNSGELIHQTINSILNQTYTNFEFIIINDASIDNTPNIIKEYAKKDNRIKIINNNKNLGISLASNKGLDIAKGKYIAMMDHDDISLPKRFEEQVKFLENNENIFLVGTGYKYIDENNKIISRNKKVISDSKKLKKNLYLNHGSGICHPSIMFRNKTKIRYRPKFIYSQDLDFFLQLVLDNKKLSNIKTNLYYYRIHTKQTTMNKRNLISYFARIAVKLYSEKIKYGTDSYNKLDPKKIININPNTSTDKYIISSEVFYNFHKQNYKLVNKYSKRYFKLFGYLNIIMIYYLISKLPKNIINLIIKIKRKLI